MSDEWIMAGPYIAPSRECRDTYELIVGNCTVAIIREWATVIEVEPADEVLSSELDGLVESFVAELIEHPDAIASVAGWSPLVRDSARRLAAARTFTEQPTVERKPVVRERQAAQRLRPLRLGYRG
jgi:hypothetical protein